MNFFFEEQLLRIANIFDNAGQVFLGTSVLTPLIFGVEKDSKFVVLLGIFGMIISWWISLRVTRIAANL